MAKCSTEIIIGKDTKYEVVLRVEATGGRGFSAFIYGGDKPHVGAAVLVSPKGEAQVLTLDGSEENADSKTALMVASYISDAFREPCAASAGVEIRGADENDLKQLEINCRAAVTHFAATYDRKN
ncbi:MAG: hypothetical protein PUD55_06515 [Firmicutes bacterium]|nr:hypothetical protein [Bacillota bacterium]